MGRIVFQYGNAVAVIPALAAEHAARAGLRELRLLLMLAADASLCDDSEESRRALASRLACTDTEVEACISFWRGAGILNMSGPAENAVPEVKKKVLTADSSPLYSGEELAALIDNRESGLRRLIDECQLIAGKILSPSEISKIVGLADYLRLSPEFIILLFSWCRDSGKNSVHYLEKTAYSLFNDGVDTCPKLEVHIKTTEGLHDSTLKLKNLFGWGERELTPNEKKYFKCWMIDWAMSYEMAEKAYQITVDAKEGKLILAYMNKVLSNWYDAGYTTIEQVDRALEEYRAQKDGNNGKSSFNTNEFFDAALKRSYAAMNRKE